jgi:hypothetical protein
MTSDDEINTFGVSYYILNSILGNNRPPESDNFHLADMVWQNKLLFSGSVRKYLCFDLPVNDCRVFIELHSRVSTGLSNGHKPTEDNELPR